MVEPSGRGLWMPGEFWVGDGVVHTAHGDPLATWHPVFDQSITNWKDRRAYVDARDVTPETFEHHPAKLLGPDTPFLSRMLEATPVFALGNGSSAALRKRLPRARIYTVAFHRSADPVIQVEASGAGLRRVVSVLVPELGGDDEQAIDRLMRGLTEGRLSRRSLDLAEQWSGLVDGPSLYVHPDDDERRKFLRVLEDQLAEAHDDATARPEACAAIGAAVVEAMEGGRADAPGFGAIVCRRPPARSVASATGDEKDPLAAEVDVDGRTTLALPTDPSWTCAQSIPPFESRALTAWRGDWKHRRDEFAERERARRVTSLRRGLLSLVLLGVFFGFLFWLLPSRPGATCDDHADCSSKVCRLVSEGLGYCAAPCKGLPGSCPDGSACIWDDALDRAYCPIER